MRPSTATSPPRPRERGALRAGVILGTNLVVGGAALAWVLHRFGGPALALLAVGPSPGRLVAFFAVAFGEFVGYAARWRLLLAALGSRVELARLTAYRTAGQSLSTLIPSGKLGGEPLRVWLLARDGVPGGMAVASVAIDRALEMATSATFACVFAIVLLRRGVPALTGALATVTLGALALGVGLGVAVRRLRRGTGLVTAFARRTGLDRLGFVGDQIEVLGAAERATGQLLATPLPIAAAFAVGVLTDVLGLVEYHLLLSAFGLPAGPLAVVAAIFATGAAHSLPVPAAVGTLEAGELWLFGMLGHPPEVGLAVGLAVRLRELVWTVPGLGYLLVRAIARPWRTARSQVTVAAHRSPP